MNAHDDDRIPYARRASHLMSHLEGTLDDATLAAMQGTWTMLEHAAADASAHARAVRSRLFWESLEPGARTAVPEFGALELLVTAVAHEEDEDDLVLLAAAA